MFPSILWRVQAEVTRHEPWSALDGGKGTGSAMLLDICKAAVGMMQRGGFIALETGGASPPLDTWKAACKAQVKEKLPEDLHHFTVSAAMLSHTFPAKLGLNTFSTTAVLYPGLVYLAGDGQAEEVADFMSGLSDDVNGSSMPAYTDVMTRKDLRGVTRFVTAYRAIYII